MDKETSLVLCSHHSCIIFSAEWKYSSRQIQGSSIMSLHNYFNITKGPPDTDTDSEGMAVKKRKTGRKNNDYTERQRYKIGRFASENRNKDAVSKFGLPESTVRNFKKQYI